MVDYVDFLIHGWALGSPTIHCYNLTEIVAEFEYTAYAFRDFQVPFVRLSLPISCEAGNIELMVSLYGIFSIFLFIYFLWNNQVLNFTIY